MEHYSFNIQMLLSAIIMGITFIGIFTEGLHGFHRTKFAMLGALTMIIVGQIYGFYSPQKAIEAIDWNVVLLLGAMMTIVAIMIFIFALGEMTCSPKFSEYIRMHFLSCN